MTGNVQKTPFGGYLNVFAETKIQQQLQLTGKALPCTVVAVSGAIITVNFQISSRFTLPQIQVPLFGPEYIRYPIQVGDKGCVFAADARLGAMTGLGGGVADLSAPGNLGALVFFPVGNKTWSAVDPNSVTIYGPNGVTLYDTGKNSSLTLTPNGIVMVGKNTITATVGNAEASIAAALISLSIGSISVQVTPAGIVLNGPVQINGPITTAGIGGSGPGNAEISGNLKIDGATNLVGTTTIEGVTFLTHEHSGVQSGSGNTGGVVP